MEDFNSQDSQEIMKNFKSIIGSRLEKLDNEKGADGELYAYSIAVANQKKKKAKETQPEETMENNRLREMVIDALTEKKKSTAFTSKYDDKFNDKRKNLPDALQKSILKKQGELDEDISIGHIDDEPHMIKAELYQIGKYAMELYKMVDKFEGPQKVDFPAWWQAKITSANNLISSAKHYLEFELKEPEVDAMVDVASEEGAIDEMSKKISEGFFQRIKAKVKGTTSGVGQSFKNIGAAIKGKPEDFKNPAVASGMSKIKSKAKNFESDVKNMLNDLNLLFPEEKLEKVPEIEKLIDSYKQLLTSILKLNNSLASGTPVNVKINNLNTTQTTPSTSNQKPTPQPTTSQKPTSQKPTPQKPTSQKPTPQKPTSQKPTSQKPTSQSTTSQRDKKGKFISTKK